MHDTFAREMKAADDHITRQENKVRALHEVVAAHLLTIAQLESALTAYRGICQEYRNKIDQMANQILATGNAATVSPSK